jgi:hypothetical protein
MKKQMKLALATLIFALTFAAFPKPASAAYSVFLDIGDSGGSSSEPPPQQRPVPPPPQKQSDIISIVVTLLLG